MADFKTAEQYVVEKVEYLETELDRVRLTSKLALEEANGEIDKLRAELVDAYDLLNIFRDFISVRNDSYFGNTIDVDVIYGKHHPEEVALLMEYYDMRPEEENEDA